MPIRVARELDLAAAWAVGVHLERPASGVTQQKIKSAAEVDQMPAPLQPLEVRVEAAELEIRASSAYSQ